MIFLTQHCDSFSSEQFFKLQKMRGTTFSLNKLRNIYENYSGISFEAPDPWDEYDGYKADLLAVRETLQNLWCRVAPRAQGHTRTQCHTAVQDMPYIKPLVKGSPQEDSKVRTSFWCGCLSLRRHISFGSHILFDGFIIHQQRKQNETEAHLFSKRKR